MENKKLAIIGTRGIPAAYGGFETFAEEVSLRLVHNGVDVLVVGDSSLKFDGKIYQGIHIHKLEVSKPGNPLKFYYQSLKYARDNGYYNVLMCGVGGAMITPFFSKEMNILINPDGLGFRRDKYAWYKKTLFFSQYFLTSKLKNCSLVFDSVGIRNYFEQKLKRKGSDFVIEYGSYLNPFLNKNNGNQIASLNFEIEANKYHLIVSRLEPENNVEMIIKGYIKNKRKFPLIIVGNTNTKHGKILKNYESKNVRFVEGIYDREKLQVLRVASFSYLHGHSVGGTNPSLLEAMGSGNLCICHNNEFNKEVVQQNGFYFSDSEELDILFTEIEEENFVSDNYRNGAINRIKEYYNWENIANKYLNTLK